MFSTSSTDLWTSGGFYGDIFHKILWNKYDYGLQCTDSSFVHPAMVEIYTSKNIENIFEIYPVLISFLLINIKLESLSYI